ncbi:uncharacterized protein LY89DRAFT_680363 [Mollisia scopiformis]|uniref:1-alkyl-2-acetylglycerophosphocholine esterase n=1 Tax=Mollisia scopiformis TaxID=149040 RepID=A0A194XU35_MOLSC|nr:uncharacterized protein LY89DRAFT_680363 [Mollisia scopiformis]KUJ23651.1 hypothetical protein LY89DRAFT_680363 [Mollisia scopiformis]
MNFFLEAAKSLPRLFPLLFLRNGLSFPAPTGPYNTSLVTVALTDTHRSDPFAPTQQSRVLMISVFTPVLPSACIPLLSSYMEPTTAAFEDARLEAYGLPSGVFESLNLQTCQQDPINHKQFPLLLFSPAAGTTRLFYSAIAQQIASTGYLVVTIDHPYDADIVVFPDNTTVFGLNFTDAQIPLVVDTRAKDISFVLDIFSKTTLHHSFHGRVKAGVFGHSLGGAASAQAMFTDPRFQGGLNLDGTFFGDVVEKGLDRPFLIFAHDGKNLTNDPSWDATWPKLTGWKREMMLADSAHYTFSDLPDVVDL